MPAINEITGNAIQTKPSEAYRNNYDSIFGKKPEKLWKISKQILCKNSVKCLKCNEEIQSKHRHDFVQCKCRSCFVDGGIGFGGYTRMGGNPEDYKVTTILTDDFLVVREYITWRSYGIKGDESAKDIAVKDLTEDHISNIIRTQKHIQGTCTEELLKMELDYRKEQS